MDERTELSLWIPILRREMRAICFTRVADRQAQASEELQAFVWRKPLSVSALTIAALDDVIAAWATTSG